MLTRHLLAATAALLLGGCATIDAPARAPAAAAESPGVVSAADPRAAAAGIEMLRQGGSATDAAIAVMLALTVVEPQSSGIGGGGFLVHADKAGEIVTLDGRETAPAGATPDWFLDETGRPLPFGEAVLTGLSIGVPGNLALAAEAHQRYGRLDWAQLFGPAIRLAREGWVLSERGAEYAARFQNRAALSEAGRALFLDDTGAPRPAGTRLANPALADTLEWLAAEGAAAFYAEPHAERLAATIAAATPRPGAMAPVDIASYSAVWRAPECGDYRGYTICGMGPPSSGATTVLAILGQLERFDLAALGPQSPVAWHLFAESQRLAYADREAYLADPAYASVPAGLTAPAYLRARSQQIAADARIAEAQAGTPPGVALAPPDGAEPVESGTSHFAIIDSSGNVVSYTSTVEGPFGSGHMAGGFYLNNELTDFSFAPEADGRAVANRVEGGKRPRSSMAPSLVFDPDGRLVMAIGAAGGGTIPVQVAKTLIGVIDWGLPAQEAIALPVLYSPGDTIVIEEGSALEGMVPALEALGHRVVARALPLKANAVEWRDGAWIGAADPRSEGVALTQ